LVAAAGVGLYGPVETYALEDWETTIATNLTGVFLATRAALPHLRAGGGGWIVAIGSGAGKQGYANLAAYSASKFGLIGYMQALGAEAGPDGIRTAVINPGSILTPFAGRPVAEKQEAMLRDPGKKYLLPEDVADAVLWLLRQPGRAWTQEMNLWPF
ncbi:MAG: SDR family oxidoreductase, partial [Chloroflexota bacterium]